MFEPLKYSDLSEDQFDKINNLKGRRVATTIGPDYLNRYNQHYVFRGIEKPFEKSSPLIKLGRSDGETIFVGLDWLYLLKEV